MKKYLSDLISKEEYSKWIKGEKVLLEGPTGVGKTTFILIEFLQYCRIMEKKVLILCNRRLLKKQYEFDLAEVFQVYADIEECVQLRTYQELTLLIQRGNNLKTIIQNVDVVVMDEVHYFYSDSDFNACGTYQLLQALVHEAFCKSVIMISATMEEVKPLLEKCFLQCRRKLEIEERERKIDRGGWAFDLGKYAWNNQVYSYGYLADFSRFEGIYVPDFETLVEEIASSEKKSIIFIDDLNLAQKFCDSLVATGKIKARDIQMLDSKKLEETPNDKKISSITLGHKLLTKILITTSVLDNGVSIHDSEVENLVIATENRGSFVQMIGRVRGEQTSHCNLFIYPRNVEYYERRVEQYEEKMEQIQQLERLDKRVQFYPILLNGWHGNDEATSFFRNIMLPFEEEADYYTDTFPQTKIGFGGYSFVINQFAKTKIGNMLLAEKNFLRLAYQGGEKVAEFQLKWIGKENMLIKKSTYMEGKEQELRAMLLSIDCFTKEQLQEIKDEMAEKFRRDLLKNYVFKAGTFSNEKLKKICEDRGLELFEFDSKADRRRRYSVKKIEEIIK